MLPGFNIKIRQSRSEPGPGRGSVGLGEGLDDLSAEPSPLKGLPLQEITPVDLLPNPQIKFLQWDHIQITEEGFPPLGILLLLQEGSTGFQKAVPEARPWDGVWATDGRLSPWMSGRVAF